MTPSARLAIVAALLAFGATAALATAPLPQMTAPAFDPSEALQGGIGTSVAPLDRNAFEHLLFSWPDEERMAFELGKALFRKNWVSAPASTAASDGLGPLYNARSCDACHLRDGRGQPFFATPAGEGPVLKLVSTGRPEGDPVYGRQIQDKALPGLAAEAIPDVRFVTRTVTLGDGRSVTLSRPEFGFEGLSSGPLDPHTGLSPRLAPPVIGMGLIEAIPDDAILALADPDDRNGDGISGRVSMVPDEDGRLRVGRFGWRAEQATVVMQTAHAFAFDMGLSSALFPRPQGDCTDRQTACLARPDGRGPKGEEEISKTVLDHVAAYVRGIAVPARRKASDPEVLAGRAAFFRAGCAACHVPDHLTAAQSRNTALSGQRIWPYSDFLLHDMGEALADGAGSEWKTPPLWGIGLTRTVTGAEHYLHDGRARSLEEAILWHGGEGETSRSAYRAMNEADRRAVIMFLESL